jgi:hypothetical protein
MEKMQDLLRESLNQSETFSDLPMSLKDKIDITDDFDIFSPLKFAQQSGFEHDSNHWVPIEPFKLPLPNVNFSKNLNIIERQIHYRGNLDNIMEEESCELDSSRATSNYHSNKDFESPIIRNSIDPIALQYQQLKQSQKAVISNEKRKCQLAISSNFLENEQPNNEETRKTFDLNQLGRSPLAEKEILINSTILEKFDKLNYLSNFQNIQYKSHQVESFDTKSFDAKPSFLNSYLHVSSIPPKQSIFDFENFNNSHNHSKYLQQSEILRTENHEKNSTTESLVYLPKNFENILKDSSCLNEFKNKQTAIYHNPSPSDTYLILLKSKEEIKSIHKKQKQSETKDTPYKFKEVKGYCMESDRNLKYQKSKAGSFKYDFIKKNKPFREPTPVLLDKATRIANHQFNNYSKPSDNMKSEICKSKWQINCKTSKNKQSVRSIDEDKFDRSSSKKNNYDL